MKCSAVVGPPGTGKTTHLSKIVNEMAVSTPNMAVCSFTKAAAGVLTSRLKNHSIRYIGTLHALAFRALKLTKESVADESKFAKWYGTDKEEVQTALSVYRYARHNKVDITYAFAQINPIIPYIRVEHLVQSYLNWKTTYQYLDFDDMILLATGKVEQFDTIIVDEAQDCTNEQWGLVLSMIKPDGRLFLGGDDDQALFTWAGANAHGMAELANEVLVLDQSYRIPRSVHRVAESTVQQISKRIPKKYDATDVEGLLEHSQVYEPMWYPNKHTVLCRDKWALEAIESVIIQRGIPYTRNGERSMFDRARCNLARAIELENYPAVTRMAKYLKPAFREDPVAACKAGWRASLDFGTWLKESDYLNLVEPTAEPLIHLSTIHGFKGEEDDHVVLVADCTGMVQNAIDTVETYDNELRVWYVGLTRCRSTLTIVGWNQFIRLGVPVSSGN